MAGRQVAPRLHDIVQAIDNIKPRYPDIPWAKVASIGNVLRHDYERVAPPVLWGVVRDYLPSMACQSEV